MNQAIYEAAELAQRTESLRDRRADNLGLSRDQMDFLADYLTKYLSQ